MNVLLRLIHDPISVYLLAGDIFATVAIGFGIIWEHGPSSVRVVANRLVVGGVIVETLCSALLFVYDANTIGSQNDEIIALRRRAAPWNLTKNDSDLLIADLRPFGPIKYDIAAPPSPEPASFLLPELIRAFSKLNWQLQSYSGPLPTQPLPFEAGLELPGGRTPVPEPKILIGVETNLFDVKLRYDPRGGNNLEEIVFRLAFRLNSVESSEILTEPEPTPPVEFNDNQIIRHPIDDLLHIEIGTRP